MAFDANKSKIYLFPETSWCSTLVTSRGGGTGGAGRDEETQSTYRGEAKVLCTCRAHPSEL